MMSKDVQELELYGRLLEAFGELEKRPVDVPFLASWEEGELERLKPRVDFLADLAPLPEMYLLFHLDDELLLAIWRPEAEVPLSEAPVVFVTADGDADLVAATFRDLVELLLLLGDYLCDFPTSARSILHTADQLRSRSRKQLAALRELLELPPLSVEELAARLGEAMKRHPFQLWPQPPAQAIELPTWQPLEDEQVPDWARLFTPGNEFQEEGHEFTSDVHRLGFLRVPSGRVVVADMVSPGPALPVQLDPGTYPVLLALARLKGGDTRVAAALLQLEPTAPVRWEKSFPFVVDSGTAFFVDRDTLHLFEERDQDNSERLVRACGRNEQRGWCWADLPLGAPPKKGEPRHNLICFSTGWGDGLYATYVGYDEVDRPAAIVAGCGFLGADTPEGSPEPAGPAVSQRQFVELQDDLLRLYNAGVRGHDFAGLAEILAPDAELEAGWLSEGVVRGALAIVAALEKRPFSHEPISWDLHGSHLDSEEGFAKIPFTSEGRPSLRLGTIHFRAQGQQLTHLQVVLDREEEPTRVAGQVPPEATPEDQRLAEALAALAGLSPLRRVWVEDLTRKVLSLGRALTPGQRSKAEELLRAN